MSTKSKFAIVLVLSSLIGALAFGLLSYLDSREALREAAFAELTAIRVARAQQVEAYFDSVGDEASVITENPTVRRALVAFRDAFRELETAPDLPGSDAQLKAFYERVVVPRLSPHFDRGEADAETLMPASRAGRYLQTRFLADNPGAYGNTFDDLVATGGETAYERIHAELHESLRFIRDEFSYYDLFLIDAQTGDILYTVKKEADFATNINEGPYRGSALGELVDTVAEDPTRRAVHVTDLHFYAPSEGKPALFVGSSIYEGNRVAGVLAIQLTVDDLNALLTARERWRDVGLKESGETYLVGEDGTMRNDSRFLVEDKAGYLAALAATSTDPDTIAEIEQKDTSILLQEVDTEAVRAAFSGRSDTRVVEDYRGVKVLSAFQPLEIDRHDFALLAEIDVAEAFAPVRDLTLRMAVTSAIALPLTALLGVWIAGALVRPAERMRGTARAFLDGDETARFADDTADEWGRLGRELNTVLEAARTRLSDARAAREEVGDIITRLMPPAIAERYQAGERSLVSHAEEASCAVIMLSSDPALNNLQDPRRAADLYDALDNALDAVATREGVDILNQAGQHYAAFCGLTTPLKNHAERLHRFCERLGEILAGFNAEHGTHIRARVGFSSASMFGALIGNTSTAYEIWGDTVLISKDLASGAPMGALAITRHAVTLAGLELQGASVSVETLEEGTVEAVVVAGFVDSTP